MSELDVKIPYDVITIWGVTGHWENPMDEVIKLRNSLNKSGIVCIWTEDIQSITSKLLKQKWWHLLRQKVHYFSQKSLDYLFKNHGFKRVYSGRYPYIMETKNIADSLNRYQVIGKMLQTIVNWPKFNNTSITLKIHGEIFAIYQKE